MRRYHTWWKEATDKMELLLADPRKFVREHGRFYDLWTDSESSWYPMSGVLQALILYLVLCGGITALLAIVAMQ